MTREKIFQLIKSTNIDDVMLAIHFLGSYRIKDIKEIIPGGLINVKQHSYQIMLNTYYDGNKIGSFMVNNALYITIWRNIVVFQSKPTISRNYTPLYERG